MYRLPPHHVARPRLAELCGDYQVIVVEAAGGYGKTVLGAELVDHWRAVGIDVQLVHPGLPALLLAARLRTAALRAGFTHAAAAAEAAQNAVDAIDALVANLNGENCAFVVDDAHNASSEAAHLLEHLALRLARGQRLVIMCRQLPPGANRLRRAECCHLGPSDLALTPAETLAVCRRFGLTVDAEASAAIGRATGGWTAATVLAAARAARTGEAVEPLVEVVTSGDQPAGAVAAILDEALVNLGPESRPLLAQIARLPLLDAEVVGAATGYDNFFQRALAAGIPFTPSVPSWWDLPGPVRDFLATLAPMDCEAVRAAARAYHRRQQIGPALQLLLAAGDAREAIELLAGTPLEEAERLDLSELRAVFDQLPPQITSAYPQVLLVLAHCFRVADRSDLAYALAEQAQAIGTTSGDVVLARSASALLIGKHIWQLDGPGAESAARDLLVSAGPDEQLTRARAAMFLGHVLSRRYDANNRRDDRALAQAIEQFTTATNLFRALGMPSMVSRIAVLWAILVEFPCGQSEAALDRLQRGLDLVADRPRRWAHLMSMRAWVAADAGLDELARVSVEELFRVADMLDDETMRAFSHWRAAIAASYRGDDTRTLHHVRQAELHKDAWWDPASADFLAEAVELLDRVGLTEVAREYLARVKAEPKDAWHLVVLAEAALEARHGDPVKAEEYILTASAERVDPRELWRVTLLRAFAAFRRGEDAVAAALASHSFEEAARLGQPRAPLVRERAVTEELLGLAAATGHPAAVALRASSLPIALCLLGRFELTVGGRPVPLGSGQQVQLLKYVAISSGGVHSEQAIETIWPEAERAAGRHRLRTVLNRLRSSAGEVVVRSGDMLHMRETVRVDLKDFLAEARRALALTATDMALASAVARGAMASYRGDVLLEDRYEDWAEKPRQHARGVMLDLLDLCATEAAQRGDLDSLRRTVEKTIEFAPYDDARYLRAASALLQQGRRGEALSIVHRARLAFAEIGLGPPQPLLDLERSIVT